MNGLFKAVLLHELCIKFKIFILILSEHYFLE